METNTKYISYERHLPSCQVQYQLLEHEFHNTIEIDPLSFRMEVIE